jgi:hypothetical protein
MRQTMNDKTSVRKSPGPVRPTATIADLPRDANESDADYYKRNQAHKDGMAKYPPPPMSPVPPGAQS